MSKTISRIEAYFDLDYKGDKTEPYDADNDALVYSKDITAENRGEGSKSYEAFGLVNPDDTDHIVHVDGLKVKSTYFKDGKAYLVVVVTDSSGKTKTKRIKIEFKPERFQLN